MTKEDFFPILAGMANLVTNDRRARAQVLDDISTMAFPIIGTPVEILEQLVTAEETHGPEPKDMELNQWQLDKIAEMGLNPKEAIEGANRQRERILECIRVIIRAKRAGHMLDWDEP